MLDTRFFPPDFRGKYPHMFPKDVEVWERFLDRFGQLYTGFWYDVMCGIECEKHPSWEENYKRDVMCLSKLKIDVVGDMGEQLDIIEVKPRGNMASIGQLLTYKEHYIAEYEPKKPVRTLLVAGEIDPNIIAIAEKSGVNYITV